MPQKLFLSGMDPHAPELAKNSQLGLEITEFTYAPNLEDTSRFAAVREQMRGIPDFWLHAPFAELAPCAVDPLVRRVTLTRYRQTLELAQRLGIHRIVLHGGFVPQVYDPQWYVEQSIAFWRDFLREVPQDFLLALENVLEPTPELLTRIVQGVCDPRLGLCLDVGHANLSGTMAHNWVAQFSPWLCHLHVHNNDGLDDLHGGLLDGTLPMRQLLRSVRALCPNASYTLETHDCAASLDQWKELCE